MARKVKVLILSFFILAGLGSCGGDSVKSSREGTSPHDHSQGKPGIEFRDLRHDFGTVKHGEKLAYTFIYKNTGNIPLVVNSARADCGCTLPEYDAEPVAPGEEGKIKVVFNTTGFSGYQTKTVQLSTNAGNISLAVRAVIE
jgi:hypothetical protein